MTISRSQITTVRKVLARLWPRKASGKKLTKTTARMTQKTKISDRRKVQKPLNSPAEPTKTAKRKTKARVYSQKRQMKLRAKVWRQITIHRYRKLKNRFNGNKEKEQSCKMSKCSSNKWQCKNRRYRLIRYLRKQTSLWRGRTIKRQKQRLLASWRHKMSKRTISLMLKKLDHWASRTWTLQSEKKRAIRNWWIKTRPCLSLCRCKTMPSSTKSRCLQPLRAIGTKNCRKKCTVYSTRTRNSSKIWLARQVSRRQTWPLNGTARASRLVPCPRTWSINFNRRNRRWARKSTSSCNSTWSNNRVNLATW